MSKNFSVLISFLFILFLYCGKGIVRSVSFLVLLTFLSINCATIFRGNYQDVNINSEPVGAIIKVNGVEEGTTPAKIKLNPKEKPVISVEKKGFVTKNIKTTSGVGAGWLVLDILTFPVGLIVDAVTGAWYGFDEKDFKVKLEPEK